MKSEDLDALLLDRELGELSPAVAELLDSHLSGDPSAARRATELRTTMELARKAMKLPVSSPPGPLDKARMQAAAPGFLAKLGRSELYRLAACLALGAGLGWFLRPASSPPAPATNSAAFAQGSAPVATEPRSTFWSAARLSDGRSLPHASGNPFRSSLR